MRQPLNIGIPPALAQRFGLLNRGAGLSFGLSSQVVPVIDWNEGKDDTSDFYSYWGWSTIGPVAGQVPAIQLFNPAGSGKVVFLDAFEVGKSTAGTVDMYLHAAGLAGLARTGFSIRASMSPAAALQAVPSKAEIRQQTHVGVIVAALEIGLTMNPGLTNWQLKTLTRPIRLDAGLGFFFQGAVVNEQLVAMFHFREYPEDLAPE